MGGRELATAFLRVSSVALLFGLLFLLEVVEERQPGVLAVPCRLVGLLLNLLDDLGCVLLDNGLKSREDLLAKVHGVFA